jgi:hypothetical protein
LKITDISRSVGEDDENPIYNIVFSLLGLFNECKAPCGINHKYPFGQ